MEKNIKIIIAISVLIISSFLVYHFIRDNRENELIKQNQQLQLELNSVGQFIDINKNLKAYVSFISNKMDSLIQSNKDIANEIEKNKEKPQIVTHFETVGSVTNIPATTSVDSNKKDFRIARVSDKDGWYDFEAKYQIISPWSFEFTKMTLKDSYEIVQVEMPNGRKKVYVKNHNPNVTIPVVESFVDPSVVIKNVEVEKKSWKYYTSLQANWNSFNTTAGVGIITPSGLGVGVSYPLYNSNYNTTIKNDLSVGLIFVKSF